MLIRRTVIWMFFLCAALAFCPPLIRAQDEGAAIEQKAEEILRKMNTFLKSLEQFSFHTENTTDEILTSGQKLQFGHSVDVFVRRPDRLRANNKGDVVHQEFYYDGKTITLYGKKVDFYATVAAPPTIEAALDHAMENLGLIAPLADIVYRNSYEVLTDGVTSGFYVGLHDVHGVSCHHLALTRDDIDLQVWVEDSKTPLPRKLIITEKWVTGSPQFTALLTDWNLSPQLQDSLFTFVAPDKAQKIEFVPVTPSTPPGSEERGKP